MATHSSILAWRVPMDRRAWQGRVHGGGGSQRVGHNLVDTHTHTHTAYKFSISGLSLALESASF